MNSNIFKFTNFPFKTKYNNIVVYAVKSNKKYSTKKWNKIWKQINKIIHNGENKDNINCIKTSHRIENNPHVIGKNSTTTLQQ